MSISQDTQIRHYDGVVDLAASPADQAEMYDAMDTPPRERRGRIYDVQWGSGPEHTPKPTGKGFCPMCGLEIPCVGVCGNC